MSPFGENEWEVKPFEPAFQRPAEGHLLSKCRSSHSDPGSEKSPRLSALWHACDVANPEQGAAREIVIQIPDANALLQFD
jgi:hypothetical protein